VDEYCKEVAVKGVLVYAVRAHRGSTGTAPLILNLDARSGSGRFIPGIEELLNMSLGESQNWSGQW
jgi:hypothetical protein